MDEKWVKMGEKWVKMRIFLLFDVYDGLRCATIAHRMNIPILFTAVTVEPVQEEIFKWLYFCSFNLPFYEWAKRAEYSLGLWPRVHNFEEIFQECSESV